MVEAIVIVHGETRDANSQLRFSCPVTGSANSAASSNLGAGTEALGMLEKSRKINMFLGLTS